MRYKYTQEKLEKVVSEALSIAEVCRGLGLKSCGGNYKTLKDKFKLWDIDTKHFTGQGHNQGDKFKPFGKKYELEEVLIENSPYKSSYHLKARLYKEGLKEIKCEECGLEYWNNKVITLELDHVNGITNDNRIENLRILCPNCHSQTETFRRKK
jgi:hypothetical protein